MSGQINECVNTTAPLAIPTGKGRCIQLFSGSLHGENHRPCTPSKGVSTRRPAGQSPLPPSPRKQIPLKASGFGESPDFGPFTTLLGLVEGPESSVFLDTQPAGQAPRPRSVRALRPRRRPGWSRYLPRAGGQRRGARPRKAASGLLAAQ